MSPGIAITGGAGTLILMLIVWLLASRDTRQREQRRRTAQDDKQRLQAIIEERTAALSELSNHLQVVREEEKAKLARDIHDELGGILVSAKMDVAWVEKRLRERDPDAAAKLDRTLQTLDAGVETKRRIIEELRPTLLDNLGLPAALDWQVHEICDRAGIKRYNPHRFRNTSAVMALLAVVSAIVCWMPAWRAARVDPSITLRG